MNKVILIGRLGKDPELKYTPAGTAVTSFTMATEERYKDKSGKQQTAVEWHEIVVWRQLAEICGKYLTKGSKISLIGKLKTETYEDKKQIKRSKTTVVADEVEFLDTNNQAGEERSRRAPREDSGPEEEPPFNPDDEIPF